MGSMHLCQKEEEKMFERVFVSHFETKILCVISYFKIRMSKRKRKKKLKECLCLRNPPKKKKKKKKKSSKRGLLFTMELKYYMPLHVFRLDRLCVLHYETKILCVISYFKNAFIKL